MLLTKNSHFGYMLVENLKISYVYVPRNIPVSDVDDLPILQHFCPPI
jgi:hypothetical protein